MSLMPPDFSLKTLFKRTAKYGIAAAIWGPLVLGVAQCSSQNDYDPWDKRAINSYLSNTGGNYYWEYRQVRKGLAAVGAAAPVAPCRPYFNF